eukprot:2282624-Rhodomonas_salina.1
MIRNIDERFQTCKSLVTTIGAVSFTTVACCTGTLSCGVGVGLGAVVAPTPGSFAAPPFAAASA